jgi:ATP/maltotriose-dependent transcriptional regulator MalT/DNA-binding SARP family transcriptional activator
VPRGVIRTKVTIPHLAERLVRRKRLTALLGTLIETYPIVSVCATAGAGKTTAVVQAADDVDRCVAWVVLDSTDAAPGRLLTYIEAALQQHVPVVAGMTRRALSNGISHREAAGLLAEAVGGKRLMLVLDGLERIRDGEDALDVIGAIARYAPESLRLVFISRIEVTLDLGERSGLGQVAGIGERDLAFTDEEAREALQLAGKPETDARAAVEATGGWVTGVLFEAWRAARHVPGAGGETDPLYGYLSTQILDQLEPEEARFLVTTSLLEVVTPERAHALGETQAGMYLAALRSKRLPVTWSADDGSMRAHPRFREYLLDCLSGQPDALQLRRRFGALLVEEGHHEEAVEEFLRAGASWYAARSARAAITGVIERLDFEVAERWLPALRTEYARDDTLAIAELMLAMGREQYPRAAQVGDDLSDLAATRVREPRPQERTRVVSMLAWAYWHTGRIDDARALVGGEQGGREMEIVRGMVALCDDAAPPPLPEILEPHRGPLEGLLMRIYYIRGHLQSLLEAVPRSPWVRAMGASVTVGALRATGRTDQALELYQRTRIREPGSLWLHALVAVELMLDLGRRQEAWDLLSHGRQLIAAAGSQPFALMSRVLEAKLHLRLDRNDSAALSILQTIEVRAGRYAFVNELLDTWAGCAQLLAGKSDEPRRRLKAAVRSMVRSDRIFELPAAAVYLAEAEWRCGNESAADRAADLALKAASRQGSNHLLMQAIADFPSVASRRIDAEAHQDSVWHELARDLTAHSTRRVGKHPLGRVSLKDLGPATLILDGVETRPRIMKSIELLAFLTSRPSGRASRNELLDALFAGRANGTGRSYLRQALYRLKEALPDGVAPVTDGDIVRLPVPEIVTSDATRVEALLDQAARLQGESRLETIRNALEIAERGPYLVDSDSDWVEDRRRLLAEHVTTARLSAATLAFQHGRYAESEALLDVLLREDPYREQGWRLAMLLADAVGDPDRLVTMYLRCGQALGDVAMSPSEATVQLFERLRRA